MNNLLVINWCATTVYRKIFAHFIFAPLALIVSGRIYDWANSNVSNYFSLNILCVGEFKTVQIILNCLQL